jgi:hypothetical protein
MEEIVEGFGRFSLNVLKWIFVNAFLELFIRGLGYIVLKIATFGKYPRQDMDEGRTILAGLVSFFVILLLIGMYNSN